jgi:hypothetical protein
MSDKRDDTLIKSQKPTITLEALKDGKIRMTSHSLDGERVLLADEVAEWHFLQSQVTFKKAPRRRTSRFTLASPLLLRLPGRCGEKVSLLCLWFAI